tara:strand:- start:212 stop:391 length:180 start_codon:yes stop_codon:yes gene_type:complete
MTKHKKNCKCDCCGQAKTKRNMQWYGEYNRCKDCVREDNIKEYSHLFIDFKLEGLEIKE